MAAVSAHQGHGPPWAALAGALSALALVATGGSRRLACRCLFLALRGLVPLAFALAVRDARRLLGTLRTLGVRVVAMRLFSVLSVVEVIFQWYIYSCWRSFNSTPRCWKSVLAHSTPEKRLASMERYLKMMGQVLRGGEGADGNGTIPAATGPTGGSGGGEVEVSRLGGTSRSLADTRFTASKTLRPRKAASGLLMSRVDSSSSGMGSLLSMDRKHSSCEASVDNLLKHWESSPTRTASSAGLTDQDLQQLRWLELATWFRGQGRGDLLDPGSWLRRGNLEEWVAHYWFRGATPTELEARPQEREELRRLVGTVLEAAGIPDLPEGRNPKVEPFLLMSDPLPINLRPAMLYLGSSVVVPLMTTAVMQFLGFRRERAGGLIYWHRGPRRDVRTEADLSGPRQLPMVFVHGLGCGLGPYYVFLYRLSRRHSGDLYVPELPFMAMHPWETVPSAREVVAQLQDMLAASGHMAAHFVGHSFGSVVIGWVLKMSPSTVVYTTLMEPALFLTLISDVVTKVLHATPKTCYELFLRYFVFRELFTVNLISRCVFWEQSTLWPEDLRTPTIVELASDDYVVASVFVRRLLEHERAARKQRSKEKGLTKPVGHALKTASSAAMLSTCLSPAGERKEHGGRGDKLLDIMWCDGFVHGQILFHQQAMDRLFARMRRLIDKEG